MSDSEDFEGENSFARDRRLDPDSLDVECVKQADTYYKWAKRSVKARERLDLAKSNMDLVLAECQLKIRRRPLKYDLDDEKVTEGAVKAKAEVQPEYQEAVKKHQEARTAAALLAEGVKALDYKKKSLDNLIVLHGQAYFAGPTTPRNLGDIWKRSQKASEDRLTDKQRQLLRRVVKVEVEPEED